MKKLLFLLAIFTISIVANAQGYELYVEGTVASNGEGKLALMLKNEQPLMVVQGNVVLPEGMTVTSIVSCCDIPGDGNYVSDGSYKFLFGTTQDVKINASSQAVKIADIYVTVDNMQAGNYDVRNYGAVLAIYDIAESAGDFDDITSTVTVQKAAVVEELGDGNSVSIVPVAMKPGFYADGNVTALDIYYTSKTALAGLSFNLNLPHAEFYSSAFDEEGNPVVAVLNNNVYNNSAKTLSVETVDDQNLKIAYTGVKTTRAANQRYIKAADVPTKLATIYIESEESLPADIYTLTLSDIKLEEYVTAGTGALHTGKNYSTIVVGTPEQNEAIIYGYCTSSAASAISTALKNVAIADVTAATVDDGAKFTDVLVNEKGGNSYYTRESANFGTTVLPLDLTLENVDELYMIESMDAKGIVLTKAENVAANTPCIFKGTINVEGATPTLGIPSEQGLGQTTFKGTYSATSIASGEGYYISTNGKFYNDGASIRPFRGYFDGAIAGVKSFNVLLDTEDGLIDITNQFSEEDIYSLQGIKMNKAKKGVNIINGKKILKK